MKNTQSASPAHEQKIEGKIRAKLSDLFKNGYWFCFDCDAQCERVEGEQGQPDHCDKCNSHRIHWNKPAWTDSIAVGDTQLIHPGQL